MLMIVTEKFNLFPLESLTNGISMQFNVQTAIKLHVEHGNFLIDDAGAVSLDSPPELKLEFEKSLLIRSFKIETGKKPSDWEIIGQSSHFITSTNEPLIESAIFNDLKPKAQARLIKTMRKYIINKGNIAKLDKFAEQLREKIEQVSNVPAGFTNTSFSDQLNDLFKQKRAEERRLDRRVAEFEDFAKAKTTESEWLSATDTNDPDINKQILTEAVGRHVSSISLVDLN